MKVNIEVTAGPARGRVFSIDQADLFIVGRAKDSKISLPNDPYLSRQHFVIEVCPPNCKITGLGAVAACEIFNKGPATATVCKTLLRVIFICIFLFNLVLKNNPALHHELHPLHLRDVVQRSAIHRHQIGVTPFFHVPHLLAQSKIQRARRIAGSHA